MKNLSFFGSLGIKYKRYTGVMCGRGEYKREKLGPRKIWRDSGVRNGVKIPCCSSNIIGEDSLLLCWQKSIHNESNVGVSIIVMCGFVKKIFVFIIFFFRVYLA